MKLTSRERILLIFLGVVVIFALCYYVLFKPQLQKITDIAAQETQVRLEVERVQAELATGAQLDVDIKALESEIADKTKKFYPLILEDKLLVTLDELFTKAQVKSDSGIFSDITIEAISKTEVAASSQVDAKNAFPLKDMVEQYEAQTGTADGIGTDATSTGGNGTQGSETPAVNQTENPADLVENMDVTLSLTGTYDQIMSFIKELEAMERSVAISGLNMEAKENNLLSAEIIIDFYALPKIQEQDQKYLEWNYNNTYGKLNPFKAPAVQISATGIEPAP